MAQQYDLFEIKIQRKQSYVACLPERQTNKYNIHFKFIQEYPICIVLQICQPNTVAER